MRRHKNKQRKIIILSLICFLFVMSVGYAAFQTNLTINAKGTLKEPSKIIKNFERYSNGDFHSDYYKSNIVTATFVDNNNVPNNAVQSWDVSEDGKGGVKAWVVQNNSDNTKFDLYIGAEDGVIANRDSSYLFSNFQNLENINFNNNYDTSNTENMNCMFNGSSKFQTLDLSSFNTENVTNMRGMFSRFNWDTDSWGESYLSNIIFGEHFNTSKVTEMGDMFSGTRIANIDLSGFDTSNVVSMFSMFVDCYYLTELNLCSFNTKNATNVSYMFYGTQNMIKIKVGPNWNINGANTINMFTYSKISSVTTGECQ